MAARRRWRRIRTINLHRDPFTCHVSVTGHRRGAGARCGASLPHAHNRPRASHSRKDRGSNTRRACTAGGIMPRGRGGDGGPASAVLSSQAAVTFDLRRHEVADAVAAPAACDWRLRPERQLTVVGASRLEAADRAVGTTCATWQRRVMGAALGARASVRGGERAPDQPKQPLHPRAGVRVSSLMMTTLSRAAHAVTHSELDLAGWVSNAQVRGG